MISFFEKVYQVVRKIPSGKVTTYGDVALYLGEGSARAVGWAMNCSHNAEVFVPAHRVVNRDGLLSGRHHFATLDEMKTRLESEGISVKDNTIQNLEKVRFDLSNLALGDG